MTPSLAKYDVLIDLLVEVVVRELVEEPHTDECPRTGQVTAGTREVNNAKCTPES
jgi:hypothetical protein